MKTLLLWFVSKRKLIEMNKALIKRLECERLTNGQFRERALSAERILNHVLPETLNAAMKYHDRNYGTMISWKYNA